MSPMDKRQALRPLAEEIQSHKDWWLFPTQQPIQGFMGTGPVFIVGDQPSMSDWPCEHPNRQLFYGALAKVGLENAHLTDLYKRRGSCGQLKRDLPEDFKQHIRLFEKEIEILQPSLIVALGQLAQQLLIENVKSWPKPVPRIWHFSYVTRAGREIEYEAHIRSNIGRPVDIPRLATRRVQSDRIQSCQ